MAEAEPDVCVLMNSFCGKARLGTVSETVCDCCTKS
jgi:hypothetical protein